ncbi:MAG: 2OG-Fe(II) oxygenase [Dysgonamonadaceae bacterium]|jgi:hypothetical protein|nr:2OG-Fe(II) oxygenase [Dysgonamonadaceae bacterium]
MEQLKKEIANCLNAVKGSGKFVSIDTVKFVFPGLTVEGVGEIAYPINEAQAKVLIQQAYKAPYGKGHDTVLDSAVRSTWEIDADKLSFKGNQWADVLNKIIKKIKPELGLEDYTISAHLYKLLIYEKDDFFLLHKDSEKEKGMFGTLVIGLPSTYTGGELLVRFDGEEKVADFTASSDNYDISYAAFYADCDHEVKPVTSGYRIHLIYNLVQQKSAKKPQPFSLETCVEELVPILKEQQEKSAEPLIVLLGHQYTPENFSQDSLELDDRPKAELLLRAAQKANCYAKMCLVTSYLSGSPFSDSWDYYDEDVDEDAEMEEVYEESLYIENWLKSDVPELNHIEFEEEDLVVSFKLADGDPIVKESTGYMGNWGPDLMHWYHYGAVVIWSHETNAALLQKQNLQGQLEWIGYFNEHPEALTNDELKTIERILYQGLNSSDRDKNIDHSIIADWLIKRNDKEFFLKLNKELCQNYFVKIDTEHWLELVDFLGEIVTESIFDRITQEIAYPVVAQLLSVLYKLHEQGKYNALPASQIDKLPRYLSVLLENSKEKGFTPSASVLQNIFWIESSIPQSEAWCERITEILTATKQRNYINHVLVPQLLQQNERTPLINKLLLVCERYLQEKADNQPQPPADWRREMPNVKGHKKQWAILSDFLASPDKQVYDYRAVQAERSEMEAAINGVTMDLIMETIKKGSPHTLRITKTQAAYRQKLKEWDEDVALLEHLRKALP